LKKSKWEETQKKASIMALNGGAGEMHPFHYKMIMIQNHSFGVSQKKKI